MCGAQRQLGHSMRTEYSVQKPAALAGDGGRRLASRLSLCRSSMRPLVLRPDTLATCGVHTWLGDVRASRGRTLGARRLALSLHPAGPTRAVRTRPGHSSRIRRGRRKWEGGPVAAGQACSCAVREGGQGGQAVNLAAARNRRRGSAVGGAPGGCRGGRSWHHPGILGRAGVCVRIRPVRTEHSIPAVSSVWSGRAATKHSVCHPSRGLEERTGTTAGMGEDKEWHAGCDKGRRADVAIKTLGAESGC